MGDRDPHARRKMSSPWARDRILTCRIDRPRRNSRCSCRSCPKAIAVIAGFASTSDFLSSACAPSLWARPRDPGLTSRYLRHASHLSRHSTLMHFLFTISFKGYSLPSRSSKDTCLRYIRTARRAFLPAYARVTRFFVFLRSN